MSLSIVFSEVYRVHNNTNRVQLYCGRPYFFLIMFFFFTLSGHRPRQEESDPAVQAKREALMESLLQHRCLPALKDVATTLNRRFGMWPPTGLGFLPYAEVRSRLYGSYILPSAILQPLTCSTKNTFSRLVAKYQQVEAIVCPPLKWLGIPDESVASWSH